MPNQFAQLALSAGLEVDYASDEDDAGHTSGAPAPTPKPSKPSRRDRARRANYTEIDPSEFFGVKKPKSTPAARADGWQSANRRNDRRQNNRSNRNDRDRGDRRQGRGQQQPWRARKAAPAPKPAPIAFEKQYPALGSARTPSHGWTSAGIATITSEEVAGRPDPGVEHRRKQLAEAAKRRAYINAQAAVGTTGYDDEDLFDEEAEIKPDEPDEGDEADVSDDDWENEAAPVTASSSAQEQPDESYDAASPPAGTTWKAWGGGEASTSGWGDDDEW